MKVEVLSTINVTSMRLEGHSSKDKVQLAARYFYSLCILLCFRSVGMKTKYK